MEPTEIYVPFYETSEAAYLGMLLLSPTQPELDLPGGINSFYDNRHRNLWTLFCSRLERGNPWGFELLIQELIHSPDLAKECGGVDYVRSLRGKVGGPASYHRERLWEGVVGREVLKFNQRSNERVRAKEHENNPEALLNVMESELDLLRGQEAVNTLTDGKEGARMVLAEAERRCKLGGKLAGISYGLRDLDKKTDGLHKGDLVVIGARPSMGKTSLGTTIACSTAIDEGIPTLFVTLESSALAIWKRITCGYGRINLSSMRSGRFIEREMERMEVATAKIPTCPLFVDQHLGGITANRLRSMVKRHVKRYGTQVVIVDYLQKIKGNSRQEKRTYEVGEVSGVLKSIAVECDVALIALAQLNRDAENPDRIPQLNDLADSGQIERDADTVLLLYRKRDDQSSKILISKQRDGQIGLVSTTFLGQYCRFEDAAVEDMA